jgi:hypothetical protein
MDDMSFLLDTILDPLEVHINGFGAALFDGVIDNSRGAQIISLDGGVMLEVPRGFQSGAQPGGILGIVEEGTKIQPWWCWDNHVQNRSKDMDGTIDRWRISGGDNVGCMVGVTRAEEEINTQVAARLGF